MPVDSNNEDFISFALPCIGEEEIGAVVATMRSGWLTTGPKTQAFEQAFAEAVGARHALAVNSATGGLHLAMEAAGIGKDDLVLTPTWTFTATAEVTRYLGGHPVFVDVEQDTLNIDVSKLEQRIIELRREHGAKLKAIAPVHFAGQACEMDVIMKLAEAYGLAVIEDAAHAFPTSVVSRSVHDGERCRRMIGTVGHASVFSFYATKTIATGEGGMVTTDDPRLAERVRLMRLHGISRDVWNRYTSTKPSWYYEVVAPGYKYNLTDIASSIGLEQLAKAQGFQVRREAIRHRYDAAFANHPVLEMPIQRHASDVHAWHLYVLRLNLERLSIDREQFIREMAQRGVGCSVHFIPLHLQPYWRERYNLDPAMFPIASREFERVVSLPIYPGMDDNMVKRVINVALEIATRFQV
ncbi:MAG: UDP-4-amino-4,6-dideoxy-N-acetyl-beta-L-altrosamine transaminase [Deltaproteobacteria bacterium RIFOXYD12_FULL_56_24]|nr:MAG: UDP-4-amino-4,6-dideoxy-N-acetyl-beta-L-altrosamine transaminase [Deltaproteobacteria bacterium RIFOXYD12_FULL_56_24]